MVAQLVGLRLSLLRNIFTGTPTRRLAVVVGMLAGLVAVVAAFARIARLANLDVVLARNETVIAGSAIVLAFVLVPLLLQRDDPMDPRRFALFGIPAARLAFGTAASSVVALPVLATVVFGIATVVVWSHDALGVLLGLLGAVLAVATCLLCGRIFSSLSALLLVTRRAREVAGALGVFLVVLVAPGVALALTVNGGVAASGLSLKLALLLGFTPLGAAWGIPAAAANGDTGGAFLCFIIAVVTVAVLWFLWRALVTLMLVAPSRTVGDQAQPAALGWFGSLPSTPAGSIAARSLTYWARDPRYFVPLVIVPILPIMLAIPLAVAGFPLHDYALIPLPIMCLFLGSAIHNDVALDNTAVWLHIVSGKRGLADRLGRTAPVLLIGLPLIGIGSVVTVFLGGNPAALPSLLGVSTCLLLAPVGFASLISARWPYAATRPGESPFTQPQSTGSSSVFVQVGTVLGTLAVSAPAIVWAVQAVFFDQPELHWSALWWGVVAGVVVFALGAIAGGAVFNRRGPEILAASVRG